MAWSDRGYNRNYFRCTGEKSTGTERNRVSGIRMFDHRDDTLPSYVYCVCRMRRRIGYTGIMRQKELFRRCIEIASPVVAKERET